MAFRRSLERVPLRTALESLLRSSRFAVRVREDVPDLAVTTVLEASDVTGAVEEMLTLVVAALPDLRWRWTDDALEVERGPRPAAERPVDVSLEGVSLQDALAWLSQATGMAYRLDPGLPEVRVSFVAKGLTPAVAERRLLRLVARLIPGLAVRQVGNEVTLIIQRPPAPEPLPEGWQRYLGDNFEVYFPSDWMVERSEESFSDVLYTIRPKDTPEAARPRLYIDECYGRSGIPPVNKDTLRVAGTGVLRVGGLPATERWGTNQRHGRVWWEVRLTSDLVGAPLSYSIRYFGADEATQPILDRVVASFRLRPRTQYVAGTEYSDSPSPPTPAPPE
ncbi:MAG: hypothetical protein HY320_08955 [Armatimonadetes bacterium]|nr:hypothetical protein [Armatimonadota bacterium]